VPKLRSRGVRGELGAAVLGARRNATDSLEVQGRASRLVDESAYGVAAKDLLPYVVILIGRTAADITVPSRSTICLRGR
jgi:hypothetical protein